MNKFIVSTDCVVFGRDKNNKVNLLLIKRKSDTFDGYWALPGGMVEDFESVDDSAKRELEEETGLSTVFLEQLYTFGDLGRDPRGRVVSVAYYALLNIGDLELKPDTDASDAQWFPLNNLPEKLAFDHDKIITTALNRLRGKINYFPLVFELLPEEFTIEEVREIYSDILNQDLDRRNFSRKLKSTGCLIHLDKKKKVLVGKPPTLYKFDYEECEENGFNITL